ncbi:hypothetical protein BDW62DRAFT_217792 [Aspergillus aurantiobrunneus]
MSSTPINASGHFVHSNTEAPAHPSLLSMFSLAGKTAIVTGAGAGIGLAVANGLADTGANRAQEIAAEYGVHAKVYQVNITNAEAVKQVVDQSGPAVDGPLGHYSDVVDIDLNGTYYCAKYAAYYWRKQKEEGVDLNGNTLDNFTYGSFVATASMSGHIVNFPQLQAAYNATKSGVIDLCKSLAVEWVKFARANTVSPGYIATEISNFVPKETKDIWRDKIPMGREGRAEELKGAYLYLASDASSYTTGADYVVDGGYCAP